MTDKDIHRIIEEFAKASQNAVEAGFDGVEIHAAHGYLLNQFASADLNRRADQYGGSVENRYRFHVEVCNAIRKAIGKKQANVDKA